MSPRRMDLWAASAAAVAVVMIGVHLAVIDQQEGDAAPWFVAVLVVGAVSAAYGAVMSLPHRRIALVVGAALLGVTGLLAILTIGVPILLAGALCLVAVARPTPGAGRAR